MAYRNQNGKRVYCVELGRIFESIADANEFLGKDRTNANISNSITVPGRVSAFGYTWYLVDDNGNRI